MCYHRFFPDSMKQHTILLYTCTPPRENKDRLQNQPLTHAREKTKETQTWDSVHFLASENVTYICTYSNLECVDLQLGEGWVQIPEASGYTLPLPQINNNNNNHPHRLYLLLHIWYPSTNRDSLCAASGLKIAQVFNGKTGHSFISDWCQILRCRGLPAHFQLHGLSLQF